MKKKALSLTAFTALLLGLVIVWGCEANAVEDAAEPEPVVTDEPTEQADEGPSLYERLGGVYNIAAVSDDLIDRLAANDALNANEAIASARVPARFPGLKYQLTAMVCQATGGPCTYTGLSMKEAHATLNISEGDWELFVTDCKATFDKFGVPEAEQAELFAIIDSTKGDIVVAAE